MINKTRLEHDIERYEMYRTPFSVRLFIIILIMALTASGIYIYKLRKDIEKMDQKILMIKEDFQRERADLLMKIRQLQAAEDNTEGPMAD
jgi:Tfp pilus assembly protein PilO